MSHNPSPFTSPKATPEPFVRLERLAKASLETRFVNWIPMRVMGNEVNPTFPCAGTGSLAKR